MDWEDFAMYFFVIPFCVLLGVAVLFFVFAGIMSIWVNDIGASDGQHTGYITAVEHNSNLIWAADLVYFKTDGQSSQEDVYCVNDPLLKGQLEALAKVNAHVTIKYHNDFWMWRSECNGGETIIVGVE